MTRRTRWLIGGVLPALSVGFLEASVRMGWFPATLSAPPSEIVATCVRLIADGTLVKQAALSVYRIVVGVSLGAAGGLALGMYAAISRTVDSIISPTIRFVAPIPAVVWLPFCIMVFGIGEAYKISLAAFVTFLLVYIQTFEGVRNIPRAYVELAEMYEKSKSQLIAKVLMPAALPSCATGLRVALAISWIAIFFVEYSSADKHLGGLGWFIADSREVGRTEEQFAGVLVLGLVGYTSDALVAMWQRSKLGWSATLEGSER